MKIVGIFRGFPGLGRVVSGVELAIYFRDRYNADLMLFSYLQGEKYLNQKGFYINHLISKQDYSSIGIIPVSSYGEYIINQIFEFKPDVVLIDGEPLILQSLKLVLPSIKIIALLNPFDVNNSYNQPSSSLIFNDMYSKADLAIVHGFWKIDEPPNYKEFASLNTIIRKEVLSIIPKFSRNKISCILGGGTVNSKKEFQNKSINIACKCIQLASYLEDFEIHIFCGNPDICNAIKKSFHPSNVYIYSKIENCIEYYSESKLIIARAGRNTISEVLYLGIPMVVIPTGCNFRLKEQKSNAEMVEKISSNKILNINEDIDLFQFIDICKMLLGSNDQTTNTWIPGNSQAIGLILDLYNR